MFGYAARKNGVQIFLSSTEQMDKKLSEGYFIYMVNDDFTDKLIASPRTGYLIEKPIFPETHTTTVREFLDHMQNGKE